MDRFVKSLYDRLDGNPEQRNILIGIMDNAINELHNNGILTDLPEELQRKVHSDDPEERITTKVALAKDLAYHMFILASESFVLNNGDPAHMIAVKYDPRFKYSIALCIQGGLEGLYLSGIYKKCESELMHYYVQTDLKGSEFMDFYHFLLEVEEFYENFQINLLPADFGKKKKKGLLGRLFGKK